MLYGPHGAFGQALTPSQRAAQRSRREAEARIAKAAAQVVIADTTGTAASVIATQSDSSAFFATAWNILGSAATPPDQRSSPHWTVQAILQAVCDHYQVPPADVVSASRTQELVVPRQVAMYLARTLTKRSLPEIGRRFGQRRHTTVLHAVRKITSRLPRDAQLARDVAAITHKLKDRSVPKL